MTRSRTAFVSSMVALAASPGVVFAFAASAAGTPPTENKTTICHATSSEGNPFLAKTIDNSSLVVGGQNYLGGHGDHEGDIIPPFTYGDSSFPGLNYTGDFVQILANGCEPLPDPTPTPTATSTVTPTPTATSTVTPTPTATASASATPTTTAAPSNSPTQIAVVAAATPTPTPAVTTQGTVVTPLPATVPGGSLNALELAEEGATEPMAATIPQAVAAGGGSTGGSGEQPLLAVVLIAASSIVAAGAMVQLSRR